jgi:hypothetical protein
MITWPYTAVLAQDGKLLSEYRCSTLDSLYAMMRGDLGLPGVTAVITTAKEALHV